MVLGGDALPLAMCECGSRRRVTGRRLGDGLTALSSLRQQNVMKSDAIMPGEEEVRQTTYLMACALFTGVCFFCRDEAVGRHRLSILLARGIACDELFKFCTLTALRRGDDVGMPDWYELSPPRTKPDLTRWFFLGSISAKLTCRPVKTLVRRERSESRRLALKVRDYSRPVVCST